MTHPDRHSSHRFEASPRGANGQDCKRQPGKVTLEEDSPSKISKLKGISILTAIGLIPLAATTEKGREIVSGTYNNFAKSVSGVIYGGPDDIAHSHNDTSFEYHYAPTAFAHDGSLSADTRPDDYIDFKAIEAENERISREMSDNIMIGHTPKGKYEVQEGDTLYGIIEQNYGYKIDDTMAESLADMNLTKDLKMGDVLDLPSPFEVHIALYGFPDEDPDSFGQ